MEALSRPPRRRDTSSGTLSRKLSSAKHAYDGVFATTNHGPSRSSGIDDYGEIFGGSRGSSIPVLDLPSIDESEVLTTRRSSKLDYSNIFGGVCNDGVAVSYEQLFEKPSGAQNLTESARAAAKGALSSSSSPERLDKMKIFKEKQQGSIEEASSEPVDGMKQFNMSYHKTSQRNIEIKNGTTHIAQMHSTPGYTCFIDESSSAPKKTVSDEYPEIYQSQPVQSKPSSLSNLGANLVDNRRQHKRSVTTDFKEVPKRNTSKDGFTDFSSSLSDEEEVDLNATAAASVAALRKALETAQASIRIAKEIMERKGGTQRFEVKKKREEKIPSVGNNKFLGNISKGILKNGDVSEKDKAKQCDKFLRENENYKLGSAREHEAASLNNQETNRRMKEIPTTDDILGRPNRNKKNSLEEACKVVEVRNTPQDAVNEHHKSDNYIDNMPVAATHKIHELEDNNKAGIYLKDEKLKDEHHKPDNYIDNKPVAATHKIHELEDNNKAGIYLKDEMLKDKHKLETEESDSKRVCEVEMARQLPDAVKSPDNKSVASYSVREEDKIDNADVSQDDIKMDKQENFPEKCKPEINLYLPTEESVQARDCEVEITKWVPNESEIYSTGSSLIATYEVHEMEGVPLNEEKMEDKQEASFGPGRCEAEINTCLLLTEESNERGIIQAANKIEKNENLPSEEEGCKKICEDPPESEEMNNMTVPQADKESEENKEDFFRQEEYKESVEIEESEQFIDEEVKPVSNQMPKEFFTPEITEKENIAMDSKDEEVKPSSDQMPKEIFTPDIIEKENIAMDSKDEELKPSSDQVPKEVFTPEVLEKENIAMDSKDGIDDVDLHESRLKATCELKGVWRNRYLSSWWGAISEAIISKETTDNEKDNNNEHEKDNNNEHESKSTGVGALKGVWKSRYLASEWGANKEAFDVESKKKENNEIENGLENKLKGTTCELKGVWKTRYLASDWGAIKDSPVKEAEEVCQEENMNNRNQLHKEYDAEESETSAGDESDDVDESESLFAKINKLKETEISHGDGDHKLSTETENLNNAPDAIANHLNTFQNETLSKENVSVSNVANEFVDQDNLEAAAKMEDRVNETYCCEEAEIQGKMDDGPQKNAFDDKQEESSIKNQRIQNEDDSDYSSSSLDDKSYESFSEDKETFRKMEESKEKQKLLGIDGNKSKHGDEAKEVKEGKEEHLRRTAEMAQKNRDRIVVERAIREVRERAFTEARERAERAAVERATAEVRQRAMAEAREKVEKAAAAAAASKSLTGKTSVEARLRAERAAVERATSEARERAREKAALSQKATSSREQAANNDQQGSDGNTGESAQRRKARQERHQRTMERAAKALAEKNQRDLKSQKEQAERNRFAETLDAEVKRWSSGKEGNLRALLSTLQYILGPDSGWQPVSLTEIITIAAVKKSYRRANLHVHPDKLQQRGASIQQKYVCEKVFDLLKAAWNKFNSEER